MANGCYVQQQLDYRDIKLSPLRWREQPLRAIIFCEGYQVRNNPWFNNLPLRPAKGEILTLHLDLPGNPLLHFGHWLLPVDHGRVNLGATFAPRALDNKPTDAARKQLLDSLRQVNSTWAEALVLEQRAQIRPGSHDRKPYLGRHPEHKQLWLFNGLGAKGSLQAPWLSELLADALLLERPIPEIVSISRCH